MSKRCPYCLGTTGYKYKMTVEWIQEVSFSGEPIEAEQTGGGKEYKKKYCIDCGRDITKTVLRKEKKEKNNGLESV